MNHLGQILRVSFMLVVAAACTSVPPEPTRPQLDVTDTSFSTSDAIVERSDPVETEWWTVFGDRVLVQLVERALTENKDLAVATANIEAARAVLNRQRLNRSISTASSAGAEIGRAAQQDADLEISGAGQIGASWEFDASGRLEAAINSASFALQQSQEIRRDVAVTVAAETALAYVDYRGNEVRLAVAQSNADLQGESVDLLKVLFENGRATRLDLERAEAQYRTTLASLPLFEIDIRTAAIRLAVLTGQTRFEDAAWMKTDDDSPASIPSPPRFLNIGTPQDLIRRRPDIRAAEASIAQRLALGQVERARLFPTLTFSADILSLFSEDRAVADSFGFGLGPAISWEGPDLRRVRADIASADAETRAAFATYEQTVIEALGEVEIALVSFSQEQARRTDLEAAAESAERALELAKLRFDEGLDDFLDVIDAQRTLLDAQDRLENNRLATTRQAISTYRALGGIWRDEELTKPSPESE